MEIERVLNPGRRVELKDFGATAVVFPIGLRHLQKFSKEIAGLVGYLATVQVKSEEPRGLGLQYARAMAPFLMQNMLGLVAECVRLEPPELKITLQDLPHWELPPIIEAWVQENFGEEKKWHPWLAAVESVIRTATGKDVRI